MAYKPRAIDLKLREQRLHTYQTAQTISSCFPNLKHISLGVRFTGADRLSPYKQIYTGDMQAYFHMQCPSKECEGGGFDLTKAITGAAKSRSRSASGDLQCSGVLSSSAKRRDACPVTLSYDIDCVLRD
ncbi:MAG: hypothetical protein M3O62_11655 [Pseudomonadota bacterium]|nr:hypothetical protein [Pseudomonadota bacterium]